MSNNVAVSGQTDLAQSTHSVRGVTVEAGLSVVRLVSVQRQPVGVERRARHSVLQDDEDPVGAQSQGCIQGPVDTPQHVTHSTQG